MLYYDKSGHVAAAGAEAENSSVAALAEDEGWIKAELYVSVNSLASISNPLTASSFV